jgi:hypothetical protein
MGMERENGKILFLLHMTPHQFRNGRAGLIKQLIREYLESLRFQVI